MSRLAYVLGLAVLSCKGTPDGTIAIVTGEETDTFSRAPAPVTLIAEAIALDGTRTTIARTALPANMTDMGERPRSEVGAVAIRALDRAEATVIRGESLFVQWGALEATPLDIFVQRTGELARMPNGPAFLADASATLVAGRYLLETSGTTASVYDLLTLRTLSSAPALPRPARSVASVGTATIIIDEAGASTVDLSDGSVYPLEPPTGGSFAEVAGGQRVGAGELQYVVGATRGSGPSVRVLRIDGDGKATFAALSAPREGACASWVEGRGLVVIGGDPAARGAEVLSPAATVATPLPLPPDPVRGCAAVTLDTTHVLVVGGTGATSPRVIDLACTADCVPQTWPDTLALVRTEAYALGRDAAFVVGDDANGATHAYRVAATGLREIPLKVPRRGGRLVPTPIGSVIIVGGGSGLEQFLE